MSSMIVAEGLEKSYTSGGRQESVADHTWRLCLMALLLHHRFPGVDLARLIKICVVHDLGEAINGDIPAPDQATDGGKAAGTVSNSIRIETPSTKRSLPSASTSQLPSPRTNVTGCGG